MPFWLYNKLASWQYFINNTLFKCLYHFVYAYLDNIFIYSKMLEDHCLHIWQVLKYLQEVVLQADGNKYKFHIQKTKFLSHIISTKSIWIDSQKVNTIFDWVQPTSLRHVRSFLGFYNFYRYFIWDFSKIRKPLTSFTKKNTLFDWSSARQSAFDSFKKIVIKASKLVH